MRTRFSVLALVLSTIFSLLVQPHGLAGQGVPRAQPPARTSTSSREQPVDLNTASAQELESLPGVGAAYARRIIENRPYLAKNQLATRGVLPQNAYEKIKDSVVAHRTPKP